MDRGLNERTLAARTSTRCEKTPFQKAVLREPKLRKRNRSQQSMRPQRRHTQTGLEARLKTLESQRIPIRQRINRWCYIVACRKATRPCDLGVLTVCASVVRRPIVRHAAHRARRAVETPGMLMVRTPIMHGFTPADSNFVRNVPSTRLREPNETNLIRTNACFVD